MGPKNPITLSTFYENVLLSIKVDNVMLFKTLVFGSVSYCTWYVLLFEYIYINIRTFLFFLFGLVRTLQ
jgi:hypothetical protein